MLQFYLWTFINVCARLTAHADNKNRKQYTNGLLWCTEVPLVSRKHHIRYALTNYMAALCFHFGNRLITIFLLLWRWKCRYCARDSGPMRIIRKKLSNELGKRCERWMSRRPPPSLMHVDTSAENRQIVISFRNRRHIFNFMVIVVTRECDKIKSLRLKRDESASARFESTNISAREHRASWR